MNADREVHFPQAILPHSSWSILLRGIQFRIRERGKPPGMRELSFLDFARFLDTTTVTQGEHQKVHSMPVGDAFPDE
jgi:hypothetical protein